MMTNVCLPISRVKANTTKDHFVPNEISKLCFICFVVYPQSRYFPVDPYHCSILQPLCPSHASCSSRAISISHNPAIPVLFP